MSPDDFGIESTLSTPRIPAVFDRAIALSAAGSNAPRSTQLPDATTQGAVAGMTVTRNVEQDHPSHPMRQPDAIPRVDMFV